MKKILTVCLILTMLISMSVAVLAEVGGFIESPSKNQAPEIVASVNEAEDCVAELLITAYTERSELPEQTRTNLEGAYQIIIETPDLSDLNPELVSVAEECEVPVTNLAVSDMFDISATGCVDHDDHGHFDITLKADTLKNFVCLLHYYNGEWRIVKDAKVTQDGTHLEFTEDEFSPFAIVVNAASEGESPDSPKTGDMPVIYVALAAVVALFLVILALKSKKNKA